MGLYSASKATLATNRFAADTLDSLNDQNSPPPVSMDAIRQSVKVGCQKYC
jgi:hypothetical protein